MNKITLIIILFISFSSFSQSFEETNKSVEKKSLEEQYFFARQKLNKYISDVSNLGYGEADDIKTAFYWFKITANRGHVKSQYLLGQMYYDGYGTRKNKKQAAYWIKKAADNGNYSAKDYLKKKDLMKYY